MDKKKKPLTLPDFLKGSPVESSMLLMAGKFFLGLFVLMLVFLIYGTVMMWDNVFARVGLNGAALLCGYAIFWQMGLSAGTAAVNLGEILYQRKVTERYFSKEEQRLAYHPLKGFLTALMGSLPLFACAVVLALTAQRVMSSAGSLPSWLESLERREEIGGALASYHQGGSMGGTDVLRILIRMALMPMVSMIGVENKEALLTMERLSPMLVLLPGLCYGMGYLGGVRARALVHAEIEAGKRKIKSRQKRERRQRAASHRSEGGPGQLN